MIPGPVNDPTSSKENSVDEEVVIAEGSGALIRLVTTTTTISSASTTTTSTTMLSAVEVRVPANSDDAEEASGTVDLTSSDLELTTDGSKVQTIGMRFPALAVPKNAVIANAWVQFQVDEATTTSTSLKIEGQASGHALALIITGTGHRVAVAHDGIPAGAPLLHVDYGVPP